GPQQRVGANRRLAVPMAHGQASTSSDISDVPIEVRHDVVNPTVVMHMNVSIPTGPALSETEAVRGAVGVGATGASGAIDRITHEILQSLQQRRTLVVWLFDQSGSLDRTRQEIYERFDRIYEELQVVEKSGHESFKRHSDKPLL